MKPSPPSSLRVQAYKGQALPKENIYIPLNVRFLLPDRPLTFNVYHKTGERDLALLFNEGSVVPAKVQSQLAERRESTKLYVRGDQRENFLKHQEESLSAILDNEDIPMETKCEVLQSVTTSLSRELFEKPEACNIIRQRRQVSDAVDFVSREPGAARILIKLTHHDYRTYTHSVNVGFYALGIMTYLFGQRKVGELKDAATGFFLHDIGKCKISPDIINKDGALTDEEWQEVRKHPSLGSELLAEEDTLTPEVSVIVCQHHEKMDGTGYPYGLRGKQIHVYSRICALSDVFDALTTKRSYKEAIPPFKALSIMRETMHAQFDQGIFEVFVNLLRRDAGPPSAGA